MSFVNETCKSFVEVLASKASVPGGGGASALVGAIGMALGSMVGNLTTGKKKYADVEADIVALLEKSAALEAELLRLVDKDAEVFEPLSKAYGIPKDQPDRDQIMEDALKLACSAPMDIMRACCKAIDLQVDYAAKGSALAISDAGVGVAFCKAALMGASLNVFINTQSMKDKAYAAEVEKEADELLNKYCALADETYNSVISRLR
jgi:formiminotetrahydrofolate cyclodeaminase